MNWTLFFERLWQLGRLALIGACIGAVIGYLDSKGLFVLWEPIGTVPKEVTYLVPIKYPTVKTEDGTYYQYQYDDVYQQAIWKEVPRSELILPDDPGFTIDPPCEVSTLINPPPPGIASHRFETTACGGFWPSEGKTILVVLYDNSVWMWSSSTSELSTFVTTWIWGIGGAIIWLILVALWTWLIPLGLNYYRERNS